MHIFSFVLFCTCSHKHVHTHTHTYTHTASRIPPALVYSLFYQRVVADRIPLQCRLRLRDLAESDFHKLSELVNNDHSIYLLSTHYSTESIAAMTPSVYHNVAADVYRREKDSEFEGGCAGISNVLGELCL